MRQGARHPDPAAGPMPPDTYWRTMDGFAAPLDKDGCSADFWIRKGAEEVIAFFCDRTFDGMPPGWFDRFGDPVGFVPEFFRPVDE